MREAASLILLRDSGDGPEVLLVRRHPQQRFMGGAWVFPGGAVDAEDGTPVRAALRELEEEAGIRLGSDGPIVPFSRWITPPEIPRRFDTHFYAAAAPPGATARCDGDECVAARWLRPADALELQRRGELLLFPPTIRQLEQLAEFASVAELLARTFDVAPVEPRVAVVAGAPRVLLPGDPGYPAASGSATNDSTSSQNS